MSRRDCHAALHLAARDSLSYLAGAKKLIEKIKEFNPKIAVFNGKGIYEVFSGEKEFIFGKQPEKIADTDTVVLFTIFSTFPRLPFLQPPIVKYLVSG